MRLIDSEELNKKAIWVEDREGFSTLAVKVEDIRCAPTVDAAPVVHGRWQWNEFGQMYCSCCLEKPELAIEKPYCSKCGAKMDLPENGE